MKIIAIKRDGSWDCILNDYGLKIELAIFKDTKILALEAGRKRLNELFEMTSEQIRKEQAKANAE